MHATMTNLPGDPFHLNAEPVTIQGQVMFRLTMHLGRNSVQLWLTPAQLRQAEFFIGAAQQEADLADYPGADYYPEGGPDGDEKNLRGALVGSGADWAEDCRRLGEQ